MNNCRIETLVVTAGLCGLPLAVLANGMRLVSQDGFATARGEAFVATADNPSAVYYNPAGITQIEGTSLRSSIYGIYLDPTFTPPPTAANAGNTYEIENPYAAAPQTFLVHSPANSDWSFGLGLYAPLGAAIEWPQDTGFRAVAIYGRLTYIRCSPVVAIEIAPKLSFAGGVMLDYADIALEQGLLRREQPFDNLFRFSGDGWTMGYNFGLLWQPIDQLSFGMTYRSTTTVNFDGQTKFEQQPIIQPTTLPAEMEMRFPSTLAIGVSYRPTSKWNLEVNADYTDWGSLGRLTIRQGGTPPFPVQQNIPVNMNWEASLMLAVGATRYLENGWHVSAGYVLNQNSVPDDYYSPLAADLDRHFLSIGTGRRGKHFDFDVAYQFGYGPDHTVTGSTPPSQPGLFAGQSADGTYDFISHAVLVSVGYHF
jgi:long-chain fatty acid transport protein